MKKWALFTSSGRCSVEREGSDSAIGDEGISVDLAEEPSAEDGPSQPTRTLTEKVNKAKRWVCCLFYVTMAFFSGCSKDKPNLYLFSWSNSIKPTLVRQFETSHNCRVVIDTYDSNEALYAKLKAGGIGYDLIFPSNYILDLLENQKMLHQLDRNQLPNVRYLDEAFLKQILGTSKPTVDAIPFLLTFSAIGYRQERLGELPATWALFSRSAMRGRMTMLNDMREVIGAALKYLGYSLNSRDPKEIHAASELLISWKPNLAKFESEQYVNGLATAEYLIVQGYSNNLLQLIAEDSDVTLLLPDEGVPLSCDFVAIPQGARHVTLAHSFINFLCDPAVAAENMAYTMARAPNTEAYPLLSDELRNNFALFPPPELLERSELIRELGSDLEYYIEAWDRIRR